MKPVDPKPVQPADGAVPAEKGQRSGEGAATALQALIRKRKQVEGHEDPQPPDTQSPLP
jgi:hypothetical protein